LRRSSKCRYKPSSQKARDSADSSRNFWLLSVELVVFDSKEQFVSSCLHLESLSVEEMLAGSWHGLEALPSSSVCLSQHNSYRPQTLQRQQGSRIVIT
jgi:hypothetical protein